MDDVTYDDLSAYDTANAAGQATQPYVAPQLYSNGSLNTDVLQNTTFQPTVSGAASQSSLLNNLPSLNDISKFIQQNKGILGLGALASAATSGGGGGTPATNTSIPNLVANRMQVPGAAGPVTPGQPGRQYFTDTIYTDPSQQANAQALIQAQANAIAQNQLNAPIPAFAMPYNNMYGGATMGGQPMGGRGTGGIGNLGLYNYPATMTQQGLNTPTQNAALDPSKAGLNAQLIAAQQAAQLAAQQAAAKAAADKAAADKAAADKAAADAASKTKTTTPTDAILAAYQAGDFTKAQQLINQQHLNPQDIVTKYGLSPTDAVTVAKNLGYTGDLSSLNYGAAMPKDPVLAAYQAGNYGLANQFINKAQLTPQDIVNQYGLGQTDAQTVAKNLGYTGDLSGLNYGAASAPGTFDYLKNNVIGHLGNMAASAGATPPTPDNNPNASFLNAPDSSYVAPQPAANPIASTIQSLQATGADNTAIASALMSQGYTPDQVVAVVGPQYADAVNAAFSSASADQSGDTSGAKAGGIMGLAHGGSARQPRYLQGPTDGMADEINTSIDDREPAKLSHGEFVIPADVVSHLGNGNSDAGAKKLYQMMDKVRQARTGNPKQGKQIDPDKFMPGGIARLAVGGDVKGFAGTDGSSVGSTSGMPGVTNTGGTSSQGLSSYVAPYVTNMLGQGQALANAPMSVYQGPLTADASALQKQQFAGLSTLGQTGYNPMQYQTQSFTNQGAPQMPNVSSPSETSLVSQAASGQPFTQATGAAAAPSMPGSSPAAQYMNPYLSASLQPQLDALRYQSQLNQQDLFGNLTKQGAYGGSRQAVAQGIAEGNLLAKQGDIIGQGYNTAYTNAMNQFNADQQRQLQAQADTEASRQYSAGFGLNTLNAMGTAGATQQGIQQAADTAAQQQFKEQQAYPYQQLAFQQSLLQGLPVGTTSTTPNPMSDLGNLLSVLGVAGNKDITGGLKTLLGL
jgi:hypothetical protein